MVVVRADQRPDARVSAQDAGGGQGGRKLGALGDEQGHLVRRHGHPVALLEGDARGGGPDHADGVARHQDVGVGRLAAAVDHHPVDAVREDQQGALGGVHPHFHVGQAGDVLPPDAAGVHHHRGEVVRRLARLTVAGVHPDDGVPLADEPGHLRVKAHLAAVQFGVQHVRRAQAEGVHAAVRHAYGAGQGRVDGRLEPPRQVRVDDLGPDARRAAGVRKSLLVTQVVFGQGDEEAVGLLDAMGGDAPQDPVLPDAFRGGFRIVHGIARSRMEQAVIAPGGAGGDVRALDQERPQSAHRAVPLGSGARDSAAQDDDIEFSGVH